MIYSVFGKELTNGLIKSVKPSTSKQENGRPSFVTSYAQALLIAVAVISILNLGLFASEGPSFTSFYFLYSNIPYIRLVRDVFSDA